MPKADRRKRQKVPTSKQPKAALKTSWDVTPTGDYLADCDEGSRRADAFIQQLRMSSKCYLLGWVVRDVIAKGQFTGVEVGIFDRLCEYLSLAPAANQLLHVPGAGLVYMPPEGSEFWRSVVLEPGPPRSPGSLRVRS